MAINGLYLISFMTNSIKYSQQFTFLKIVIASVNMIWLRKLRTLVAVKHDLFPGLVVL